MNIIVATGADGAIGLKGNLIWRIPADLRRFKTLTMGHPVIMGRLTWESLPKRPLPGRRNIVVTRDASYQVEGAEVVHSPEEAVALVAADASDGKGISEGMPFVIGGESIYKAFLPMAERIYLTEIEASCPEADARFPFPLDPATWELEEASATETTPEGITYRYATYRRR